MLLERAVEQSSSGWLQRTATGTDRTRKSSCRLLSKNGHQRLYVWTSAGELVKQFAANSEADRETVMFCPRGWKTVTCHGRALLVEMYRANFQLARGTWHRLRANFCALLVSATAPRRIVEIGCFHRRFLDLDGLSALEQIGGDGHIHSVDFFNTIWPGPGTFPIAFWPIR